MFLRPQAWRRMGFVAAFASLSRGPESPQYLRRTLVQTSYALKKISARKNKCQDGDDSLLPLLFVPVVSFPLFASSLGDSGVLGEPSSLLCRCLCLSFARARMPANPPPDVTAACVGTTRVASGRLVRC